MRRGPTGLVGLLGALALVAAACTAGTEGGQSPSTGAREGETILIGGVGPLSEPGAVTAGIDMRWAMEQAVSDVNAQGGVLGKKLELIFEDTQNTPDVARSVAEKLVSEDHVVAVVGEYHSGAALAMVPVANDSGVPFVFAETWSDSITGGDPSDPTLPADPPSVFRIAPTTSLVSNLFVDWLENGIHAHKFIHVYEASDYGLYEADLYKALLQGTGIELVQVKVELNQADYSAVMGRLAQEHGDADVALIDVTGESGYTAVQNAFDAGLFGPDRNTICFASQEAQNDRAWWRVVPDGAGCVFMFVGPPPSAYNDMTRSVAERYQARFGGQPNVWTFEAYDAVRLVADAIERAGSTEPGAIVKALETTSFVGAQGRYSFPYGSQNPLPNDQPSWMWHQWPDPTVQYLEYTQKDQPLGEAAVVWPPSKQTDGTAYVSVRG
ncbi:MAG TPA: ABC transporter substrate-binding protein [Actinomycetota bacterium]|nr:ABC transporter substrate-binding protein [Actinomycetota bacterium]